MSINCRIENCQVCKANEKSVQICDHIEAYADLCVETKSNAKAIKEEEKVYEQLKSSEVHVFKSGAKSSEVKHSYQYVPIEAVQFIAERFELGMQTHGAWNWVKGLNDPVFVQDRKNHAIEHLFCYNLGLTTIDKNGNVDTPLDHLKAAITNCAMFCYMEVHKEKLNAIPTTSLAKE